MIDRDEFLNEIKEEQRLRKVLRNLLKEYFKEKNTKKLIEENKLRNIIRSLIKEVAADVGDEQPQRSTGINALRSLLKNIIPTIEDAYKELTTSKEQRESFRAHILNAVENSLAPVTLNLKASEAGVNEAIDLDIDVEEEKFIPARPEDEKEEQEIDGEEKEAEVESFQDIEDMNITGRNFAATNFNKIEKQILSAYEDIYADRQDREEFKDYLLTNLKLYFDRFEEELQPSTREPESPDYDKEINF